MLAFPLYSLKNNLKNFKYLKVLTFPLCILKEGFKKIKNI